MNWRGRISVSPDVCGGKARINGTEVCVSDILNRIAEGAVESQIIVAYPVLKPEDIKAAVSYAAELMMVRY